MPLLILDKDKTIVTSASDPTGYVNEPHDQIPIEGISEALDRWVAEGWKIVIASNQGGIACGYKTLEQVFYEMRYCLEFFPQIQAAYFCPNISPPKWLIWLRWFGLYRTRCYRVDRIGEPESAPEWYIDEDYILAAGKNPHGFRKPGGMMLYWAATQYTILFQDWPQNIVMVGDSFEDEGAAEEAGILFIPVSSFLNSTPPILASGKF